MCCKMVMKKKKNTRPLYQMPIRTTTKSSTSVSTISPSVTTQRPSPSTTYNPDKIQLSKYTVIRLLDMHLHENVTIIFSVNRLITIETWNSFFLQLWLLILHLFISFNIYFLPRTIFMWLILLHSSFCSDWSSPKA